MSQLMGVINDIQMFFSDFELKFLFNRNLLIKKYLGSPANVMLKVGQLALHFQNARQVRALHL